MKHGAVILFLGLLFSHFFVNAQNEGVKVTNIDSGTDFTCLDIDDEQTLWLGTKKRGLFMTDKANGIYGSPFPFSQSENFNKLSLTSIKTKTQGGKTSIWVGSHKASFSDRISGGVDLFIKGANGIPFSFNLNRNKIYAAGLRLPVKEVGLPNNQVTGVHIDKLGNVWSTHGWEDLTITGSTTFLINPFTNLLETFGQSPGYYVRPGAIARKGRGSLAFSDVTIDQMPYPAWTIKTPITRSAQTRRCLSLTSNQNEVWMGFFGYMAEDETTFIPNGIARFDLGGSFLGFINEETNPELPFERNPVAIAMHHSKSGDTWVAFNRGIGFAVLQNDTWTHVENLVHFDKASGENVASTFFPDKFNMPFFPSFTADEIDSKGNRVFIGTTSGLLVYKGAGSVLQDSSYQLITTADGLSSNTIKAVKVGLGGFVYVVTDAGVDEIFIPAELSVFHVKKKEQPFADMVNGQSNYQDMLSLTSISENTPRVDPDDVPKFAADGTTSSVFRYFTDDFDRFYEENTPYGLMIDDEIASWDWDLLDTVRYGKFTLKPKDSYEEPKPNYVDIIYRHPSELPDDVNRINLTSRFAIIFNDGTKDITLFEHPIEFVLPPVLLVHGVWTSIESLEFLENHLIENANYKEYQILKIFKPVGGPEKPTHGDAKEVPNGIDKLISFNVSNGLSAGKVSVVCHSRGGLNTRAYIEELDAFDKKPQPYRHDIHSLITLNTPHAGSQLANIVVDNRKFKVYVPINNLVFELGASKAGIPLEELSLKNEIILDEIKSKTKDYLRFKAVAIELGDLFSMAAAEADREDRNGAKQLLVDAGYVSELNDPGFLIKLAEHEVPIHAVATNFRACELLGGSCSDELEGVQKFEDVVKKIANRTKKFKWLGGLLTLKKYYNLVAYTDKDISKPKTVDGLLQNIFNGEDSDMIVPESSMEAGLDEKYISTFEGLNINHISAPLLTGVTASSPVANRVSDLLVQNPHDSNSNFTKEGVYPPALEYKFEPKTLEEFVYNAISRPSANENPLPHDAFFSLTPEDNLNKQYKTGDTLHFSIKSENVDKALVVFEKETGDFTYHLSGPEIELSGNDQLSFIIPDYYAGYSKIKAIGLKDDHLFIMDHMFLYSDLADNIELTGFEINSQNSQVEIAVQTKYYPQITAFTVDSTPVKIELNETRKIVTYLTDTSVAKLIDDNTVLGIKPGITYLISAYDNNIDTVLVSVTENLDLEKTILSTFDYYVPQDSSLAVLDWSTSQEFNCREFTIERKTESETDFIPVSTKSASGTSYNFNNYQYVDKTPLTESTEYRIKVTQNDDSFFYSAPIKLLARNVISFVFDEFKDLNEDRFKLLINPTSKSNLMVGFNSDTEMPNAEVIVTNMNGVLVSKQTNKISKGDNHINVEIPDFVSPGVYIVSLYNNERVYSKKVMITE